VPSIGHQPMSPKIAHIGICICTYRRPEMLRALLERLYHQDSQGLFTYSIVVVDNDQTQSAKAVVSEFGMRKFVPILYRVEPERNIALARNRAVSSVDGEYVAFIDDDEFPAGDWLLCLYQACSDWNCDGVLGPVLPHFDQEPPEWIRRGGFFDRPRHRTGFQLGWAECRTGNVLIRKTALNRVVGPFRREFGTGGEDQDFFRRAIANGSCFIWCNEAIVYETVPPVRWAVGAMVRRALLRGRNSWRHPDGRWAGLTKSIIAIPVYLLSLPIALLVGYHFFVKSLIRLGDHAGKVLAALRLNPIRTRGV
jgi:succinoglycan biosynthesis protein ExoM